jgi:hypothetical protein
MEEEMKNDEIINAIELLAEQVNLLKKLHDINDASIYGLEREVVRQGIAINRLVNAKGKRRK